jgi:hypothetical protein
VGQGRAFVAETSVHGFGAGHVMACRANPADAGDDPRQFFDRSPDHEPFKTAELRNLEKGVFHAPVVIEEDLYFPVSFQPGDRIDADSFRHI